MENGKENRAARRSKQMLVQALDRLLERYPYQEITIKEICAEADLVRKTFYNNFSSKDDILEYKIQILSEEFMAGLEGRVLTHHFLVTSYFSFWTRHQLFLSILQRNGLFHILLRASDHYMPTVDTRSWFTDVRESGDETLSLYANAFNSSGLWHILEIWVEQGCRQTPEEMADIYCRIVQFLSDCTM